MFQEIFMCWDERVLQENAAHQIREQVLSLVKVPLEQTKQVGTNQSFAPFHYELIKLPHPVDHSGELEQRVKQKLISREYQLDLWLAERFIDLAYPEASSPAAGAADAASNSAAQAAPAVGPNSKQVPPLALVMDMDMTTVQIEGIDEIARKLGVFDQVAAITHEAMHGHLEFSESLQRRVALLKGGKANEVLAAVRAIMTETDGLKQLLTFCNEQKAAGIKFLTCIASGGFHELISVIDSKYHLNKIAANRLAVDSSNGTFTGKVDGPIIDAQAKAHLVISLKKEEHIAQERIIVVGDGANDLLMMQQGGLGIAYHAKPKVQEQARYLINYGNLSAIVALLSLATTMHAA